MPHFFFVMCVYEARSYTTAKYRYVRIFETWLGHEVVKRQAPVTAGTAVFRLENQHFKGLEVSLTCTMLKR
jgi:hypothetical protein